MIKFKLPQPHNIPVYCMAAGVLFLAFSINYIADHPHVDVCRGVVLDDIKQSQKYQASLDQLLRTDFVTALTEKR